MSALSHNRTFLRRAIFVLCASAACARGTLADDAGAQAGPRVQTPRREPDAAAEKQRKRRATQIMLYVVVGIAVCGVILIVLVMLGGRRVRQMARRPLRKGARLDPFWYLKGRPGQSPDDDHDTADRD